MSDPVVVIVEGETAPTPPSAPTPPDPGPSDAIVEIVHDDAMTLGYALATLATMGERLSAVEADIVVLSGNLEAQRAVIGEVVSDVEEIADEVESLEPGNQLDAAPDPQPEDSAPGKTHWLHRSPKEWAGK